MNQVKPGDTAICHACGETIAYIDPYWTHVGPNQPRHIALPGVFAERDRLTETIAPAIRRERAYQEHKWGSLAEHPHTVGEWLLLVEAELQEAKLAWCKGRGDVDALRELLQVVSVGVACIEQHGVVEREEV